MIQLVKAKLDRIGYVIKDEAEDDALIEAIEQAAAYIKNECSIAEIPDGLKYVWRDMATGEFLLEKRTFHPESLAHTGLMERPIRSLQEGGTNVSFVEGKTQMQAIDELIARLLTPDESQLDAYREVRWG